MTAPLHVLVVEDSAVDATLIVHELRRTGRLVDFERVEDAASMRAALETKRWDVIVSDWSMPAFGALGALEVLKQLGLDLPFIVVSGTIGEETAVEAMRAGAHDYVVKRNLARLGPAVERELREREEAGRSREAQLRQAQKMEAVGRLAGGIAHDFNNLLSVILSYSDVLIADTKEGDPVRDDVEQIRRAGARAADLARQLIHASRQQVVEPSRAPSIHVESAAPPESSPAASPLGPSGDLPRALAQEVLSAASIGDYERLVELIEALQPYDDVLAGALKELLERYAYDEIERRVKQAIR